MRIKACLMFAVLLTLLLLGVLFICQLEMRWSKTFGGADSDLAESIVQTSDGGYALAGVTESYGAGGGDFWIVKTDSSGNEEWSKTFGGANYDFAESVIQTSDGGYALAGSTESYGAGRFDFWLVKTDFSGNEEWSKTFGGENDDWAYSVIQTSDGGYTLAGSTMSYGAGGEDFWLLKTDSSGNEEWSKTFGGENGGTAWSIVQTSDGGYALAGESGANFWLVKLGAPVPDTLSLALIGLIAVVTLIGLILVVQTVIGMRGRLKKAAIVAVILLVLSFGYFTLSQPSPSQEGESIFMGLPPPTFSIVPYWKFPILNVERIYFDENESITIARGEPFNMTGELDMRELSFNQENMVAIQVREGDYEFILYYEGAIGYNGPGWSFEGMTRFEDGSTYGFSFSTPATI